MAESFEELNAPGCPRRRSVVADKMLLWFGALMMACVLVLLAIMLKWVGAPMLPGGGNAGEDGREPRLAAGQAMLPPTQAGDPVVTFPAGLGNEQMQLIADPTLPAGIGNQQMRLIAQSGPYLGLGLSDLPPDIAASQGLPSGGALVSGVVAGSPGDKAGIAVGDVLTRLDNAPLAGPADVGRVLAAKRAGQSVAVVVVRGGSPRNVAVTLENVPLGLDVGAPQKTPWIGLDVQDVDAVMRIQFNLPDDKGVLIGHVAAGSPAQAAGLAVGDMIRRVGASRIANVAQFQTALQKAAIGDTLRLSVMRAGQPAEVPVTLAARPAAPPRVPMVAPAKVTLTATWIGMDAEQLQPKDIPALGLPQNLQGILVKEVEGQATMVGFQTGDVIVAINGTPTPDLDAFLQATRQQSGAAVEVVRGAKHMFVSVPPLGFTAQGTQLKTGVDRKFRQVAAAAPGLIGVLSPEKSVNAQVASEQNAQAVILVDLANRAYAVVELNTKTPLPALLAQYGVGGLAYGDMSPQTAAALRAQGIATYGGVAGTVLDAVALYESQGLSGAGQ